MRLSLAIVVLVLSGSGIAAPPKNGARAGPRVRSAKPNSPPAKNVRTPRKTPRRIAARSRQRPNPAARCRDIFCTAEVVRMDEGDEKGSRRLTQQQVEQVMHGAQKPLAPCLVQARRRDPDMLQATVEVVVDGQGRVLASRVNSKRYSPLSRCVHGMLRRIRFPRSDVRRTVASFTLGIPD